MKSNKNIESQEKLKNYLFKNLDDIHSAITISLRNRHEDSPEFNKTLEKINSKISACIKTKCRGVIK